MNIIISLLYACILVQCIEETSERTDTGTEIISSILYVNGGALLFQLPPINKLFRTFSRQLDPGRTLICGLCLSATVW